MPTFGYETKGATAFDISGRIIASLEHCDGEGVAQSITVYLERTDATTRIVKCAIYDSDLNLLGVTEQLTLNNPDGWYTFNFVDPKPVLSVGDYWLVVWGWFLINAFYDTPTAHLIRVQDLAYNEFPTVLGGTQHVDLRISLYCTYGVAPPPTWTLRVESTPISVPVVLNGSAIGNTPVSATVEEGTHTVEVEPEVTT